MGKQKQIKIKIGRDAGNGRFIPVEQAKKDKEGAVVETITKKK